jgi:septal ring factor EnvC (AmiA/AmiB activator)
VYGDKPCAAGQGRLVDVKETLETPSARQLTSQEQLEREKKQAEALRKARLKREKAEDKTRQKAWRQAQKEEKKRKARCKALAKSMAKGKGKRAGKQQDAAKREEYERECRDAGGQN